MAIPILKTWSQYFINNPNEGLGSSYERIVLNNKLEQVVKKYNCKSLLEVPIFGFTGITGINSMGMAKFGLTVDLVDNHKERLSMVKSVWQKVGLLANFHYQENFIKLNFSDNSFDFSWNFSAIWFVENLQSFLSELTRVTKKIIIICIPNRQGIGFLSQKYISGSDLRKHLIENNIIPRNIIKAMKNLNWQLVERNYIDVPPWPDIGMEKEKFLKLFHLDFLVKKDKKKEPLCIINYYNNKQPDFAEQMMKHFWFEKHSPNFIKLFWAHHRYMIFTPKNKIF